MSMFEDKRYRWRETYFVLFDAKNRPLLKGVAKTLSALNKRFELTNQNEDDEGRFDSLTLISRDDFAALDICYTGEAEVQEQVVSLVEDMKKTSSDEPPPLPWSQIKKFDGRFDVLHFEQVAEDFDEDSEEEMLDPSALLIVLGALAKLTGGVAVDPQAGTFLVDE
jgi:hypothetical protein